MTAIKIKAVGPPRVRRPRTAFMERFTRGMIILCTSLALVLSGIAVCNGHWLLADGQMYGLWQFCTAEAPAGTEPQAEAAKLRDPPNCISPLSLDEVQGLEVGLGLCRSLTSLAVVAAIFGLELLVVSQVGGDQDMCRRWILGSALVLVAFAMSVGGMLIFLVLLQAQVSLLGFTLAFWCQFTAVFLFFLNGIAARHIHHMALPPFWWARKC